MTEHQKRYKTSGDVLSIDLYRSLTRGYTHSL